MEKWAIFDQNHPLTPLEKWHFFHCLIFCFYSLKRRFFVLEYLKTHFPSVYCLRKKFGKMTIFPLFELFLFIAWKHVFSFQNIVKRIFLAYITFKKKIEKWPIFDQNHELTPLEKWQFFDFLNFLFLQPKKTFFRFILS